MRKFVKNNRLSKLISLWLVIAMITVGIPSGAYAAELISSRGGSGEGLIVDENLTGDFGEELLSEEPLANDLKTVPESESMTAPVSADSEASSELEVIEINQGMSKHTGLNDGVETYMNSFVAKKQTVIMMKIPGSDAAGYTEQMAAEAVKNYKMEARQVKNGRVSERASLLGTGESFAPRRAYDINCNPEPGWYAVTNFDEGPDKGTYNFYMWDGDDVIGQTTGVTFYETKKLNILVLPVNGYWSKSCYPDAENGGGAPAAGTYNVQGMQFKDRHGNKKDWKDLCSILKTYMLDVYPVTDVNFEEGQLIEAGNENYDMVEEGDGQWNLWNEARNRQVKIKGKDKYDLILAFVAYRQDYGSGQGYTYGKPANIITYTDPDMLPTVVHEIAHCYMIGDEYDGGSYNIKVNYAPNGYKGRDLVTGAKISAITGANEYWKDSKMFKNDPDITGPKKGLINENGAGTVINMTLHPYSLERQEFVRWGGVDINGNATESSVNPTITYMGSGYHGCDGCYWTSSILWDHLLKSLMVKARKDAGTRSDADGASGEALQTNAEVYLNAVISDADGDDENAFLDEDDFYYDDDWRFGSSNMIEVNGCVIKDGPEGKPVIELDPMFSYEGDLEYIDVLDEAYDDSEDIYTFAAVDENYKVIESPVDGKWAACEFYGGFYNATSNKDLDKAGFSLNAEYPSGTKGFVIFKGRIKDISDNGSYDKEVFWTTRGKDDYARRFENKPEGYLYYADVNSSEAVVQWDVVYPDMEDLYTEIYYCPEGDDGEAVYVGSSKDEKWKEYIADRNICFETDGQFTTKWTRNAYVWIKVTNGVNSVDVYSDENDITLSNSEITLSGKGIKKGDGSYYADYTGEEICPAVSVKAYNPYTGKYISLKKDVDYTVSYEDNRDVGHAKAIVQGIGEYGGKKAQVFEIVPRILEGTPENIPDMVYSKDLDKDVKKYLRMTSPAGTELEYDEDFEVKYSLDGKTEKDKLSDLIGTDPAKAVTVNVIYYGKGSTAGKCKKGIKFDVLPSTRAVTELTNENTKIELKKDSFQYTGKAIKPAIKSVTVTVSGNTINLKSSDYKVIYSDNIDIGKGGITVVGKKNYSGSKSASFTITQKEVGSISVSGLKDQMYTGTAIDAKNLPITVKAGGITLTKDIDYTVENVDGCDYVNVTTSTIKKSGAQPKIMIKLKEAGASGKVSMQPKVKWNSNVNESKKTVIKSFSIVKLKLDSASVTFTLSSNDVSGNRVKSSDGTQIGILRKATKDETAGKKNFSYVIEGNIDTLKNADISEAAGLMAGGNKIDPKYYTVKVSNTGNGKIGSITLKADKDAPYKGSRTIRFLYTSVL